MEKIKSLAALASVVGLLLVISASLTVMAQAKSVAGGSPLFKIRAKQALDEPVNITVERLASSTLVAKPMSIGEPQSQVGGEPPTADYTCPTMYQSCGGTCYQTECGETCERTCYNCECGIFGYVYYVVTHPDMRYAVMVRGCGVEIWTEEFTRRGEYVVGHLPLPYPQDHLFYGVYLFARRPKDPEDAWRLLEMKWIQVFGERWYRVDFGDPAEP